MARSRSSHASRLLAKEQCSDEKTAQNEEGIERHGGPGNHQERRNGQNDVHVRHKHDEHGDASETIEAANLAKATSGQRRCGSTLKTWLVGA